MNLEILKLASDTKNNKNIANCTHVANKKNPLCGDEMKITLTMKNDKIVDFGYECKSCIYCQASASILSKLSLNKSVKIIKDIIILADNFFIENKFKFPKDWKKFEKLFNKENLSRKECILLPFKTLKKALNE